MKDKTRQTASSRNFCSFTKQEEEAKKAFMKYHPMENNLSLKVDDEYKRKINVLFGEA